MTPSEDGTVRYNISPYSFIIFPTLDFSKMSIKEMKVAYKDEHRKIRKLIGMFSNSSEKWRTLFNFRLPVGVLVEDIEPTLRRIDG